MTRMTERERRPGSRRWRGGSAGSPGRRAAGAAPGPGRAASRRPPPAGAKEAR